MAGGVDRDWYAACDPRTPQQQLADLAARRWDLHPVIAANPSAYPALRQWIASVNPGSGPSATPGSVPRPQSAPIAPAGPPAQAYGPPAQAYGPPTTRYPARPAPRPRRRGGVGGWLAGCGCLTVVVLVIAILLGGSLLGTGDDPSPGLGGGQSTTADQSTSSAVDEHMATYEAELAAYYELAAQLEGNPVAPLVTRPVWIRDLEARAAAVGDSEILAKGVAEEAQRRHEDLQQLIDAAEDRRGNSSGTIAERLVDEAGDGFIDIRWDADTACGASDEGWSTVGCVAGDALTIHLMADSEFDSDWGRRMIVQHELAHVYQRADAARFDDSVSDADRLVEQGLFQGSDEAMADCYALTYYDEWSLVHGNTEIGYGYVCNDSERDAIRRWAADLDAPMR